MNEPKVHYEYDVLGQPAMIQMPVYHGSRIVRCMPRTLTITANSGFMKPGQLYVLIDGRALRADGGFAERGQSGISFEDGSKHPSRAIEAAPPWVQELVDEVREFERKRLA